MGSRPDYVQKKFGPLLDKTLENAVAACIGREFPRLGGPRIRELCARMLLDVVDAPTRKRVPRRPASASLMARSCGWRCRWTSRRIAINGLPI
jgi:hypothetical protein